MASPDFRGTENAATRRADHPQPAAGWRGERWSRERLRRLQSQVLAEEGYEPRSDFDVGDLPEQEQSWDIWAAAPEVLELTDSPGSELGIEAFDRLRAERNRRRNLVEHARGLIAIARLRAEHEDLADVLSRRKAEHAQKVAGSRSWLRAAAAADAVFRLPPAVRSRASTLTLRCPDAGCRLVQVIPRRQDSEADGYPETLLIVTEGARNRKFAWAVRPHQPTAFPRHLPIRCGHGTGTLLTAIAALIDRSLQLTRTPAQFEGASWTARR